MTFARLLLAVSLVGAAVAFAPRTAPVVASTALFAEVPASASAVDDNNQAKYGSDLELPDTYVRCGKCQTAYAFKDDDLGSNGRGRRLECSVCGHTWFQSRDRLLDVNNGFELVPLPEMDLTRIKTNIEEGKSPKFVGDAKLYVGNLDFRTSESDLTDFFAEVGAVGDVAIVSDHTGRSRGFAFVTMRTQKDGDAAVEQLNDAELNGRNLAVRPANS